MENKIKNPVSKKNIFFFSIFDRLINSIEKYVHKTEEDTFAENFDIVNEDSMITVSPKGSTVEKLSLGDKYSTLRIDDENFIAYVDVTSDDRWIESRVNYNNKAASFILQTDNMEHIFIENNINVGEILFDKNGIAVTTNHTTYNIHEPQLSTIVNACEYSYDEDNDTYKLKMLPKVNNVDFANTPLEIDFGKLNDINLKMGCNDEGLIFSGTTNDSENKIWISDGISILASKISDNTYKNTVIKINCNTNQPDIEIIHNNTSNEINANQVLRFVDQTNDLEVTFTVAELIALKALLPTT